MLRLFISFILFCLSCSIPSLATIIFTIDSIKYSLNDYPPYTTATVRNCYKNQKNISIPAVIDGRAAGLSDSAIVVTRISSYAFQDNRIVENISLPNTIKTISNYGFYGSHIKNISLPDSISIGDYAFAFCYLTSISLPNSTTNIGKYAFMNNWELKSVIIPSSIRTLKNGTFKDCEYLETVEIPEGVSTIGYQAFYNCKNLENVSLPNSIKSIGQEAFYNTAITTIHLSDSITSIGKKAFENCSKLEKIDLPNSLTAIEERTFLDCANLSLSIPPSVTTIGDYAIHEIKNIYLSSKTPQPLGYNSVSSSIIYVPWDAKSSYMDSSWGRCLAIRSIGDLPHVEINLTSPGTLVNHLDLNNILSIGSIKITGAINGTDLITINRMKNLDRIDLSETTIVAGGMPYYQTDKESYYTVDNHFGYKSFHSICPSIIHLPNVKVIESGSLKSQGITELSIPNGLETIKSNAFSKALITQINLPSVQIIEDHAFSDCSELLNVNIPSAQTIGDYAFAYCSKLQNADLSSARVIGDNAFSCCHELSDINLSPLITSLGSYSFMGCMNLKDFAIPKSIATINAPFYYNSSHYCGSHLSKIIIEDSEEELNGFGGEATVDTLYIGRNFLNLSWKWRIMNVVTIGTNVTSIPSYAFNGSCGFSKVSFHKSITSIGDKAFENSSIKEVYSENPEPPEISENTFTSTVYANATLYVPSESLTTYWLHRYWGKFASIKPLEDQTIIQTPQVDNLKININGNSITVENSGDSYFQIFDISGKRIYHGKQSTVSNLSSGIYILKLGNQTKKFAITM